VVGLLLIRATPFPDKELLSLTLDDVGDVSMRFLVLLRHEVERLGNRIAFELRQVRDALRRAARDAFGLREDVGIVPVDVD
jgi:hypothetical protein